MEQLQNFVHRDYEDCGEHFTSLYKAMAREGVHLQPVAEQRRYILNSANERETEDPVPWKRVGGLLWCCWNEMDAYTDEDGRHLTYEETIERVANQLHPRVAAALLGFMKPYILNAERVWWCDYFAGKTLEGRYLLRDAKGAVRETPAKMYARCVAGAMLSHHTIDNLDAEKRAVEMFMMLTEKRWTPATPSLMNGGRKAAQYSSCMLVPMGVGRADDPDSMQGIMNLLSQCALLSARGAGIGFRLTMRASDSLIAGSGGRSKGMPPWLTVYNETRKVADQGGGKRKGAWAAYLSPHDADCLAVLNAFRESQELRDRGVGDSDPRILAGMTCGVWLSDLFMNRVRANQPWSVFSCHTAPGLDVAFGDEYEELYERYEREGRAVHTYASATNDVWRVILETQVQAGIPYVLFKDQIQRTSPQRHLGTILLSNLCTEIVEVTHFKPEVVEKHGLPSQRLTAMCNLASISLPACVRETEHILEFSFVALAQAVRQAVRFVHNTHYATTYPDEYCRANNMLTRPMAIGKQGLAVVFFKLGLSWTSEWARALNAEIAECMCYYALDESNQIAREEGRPYPGYEGSPLSKGEFHWHKFPNARLSGNYNWEALRDRIAEHGVANSLLIGPMPTASTAQILGNPEAFAPIVKNVFARKTDAGSFVVVNEHLVEALKKRGLWTPAMRKKIIANRGFIEDIEEIPRAVRDVFLGAFEVPVRLQADMMLDALPFTDQSLSFNVFMRDSPDKKPLVQRLSTLHFYTWQRGAKTGMYYLRQQRETNREAVGVDDSDSEDEAPPPVTQPVGEACEPGCDNCG